MKACMTQYHVSVAVQNFKMKTMNHLKIGKLYIHDELLK
jgi:hypothetical protein